MTVRHDRLVTLLLGVAMLLLVCGVLLVFNEVGAARRADRPVRRGFVGLCVLVVLLGIASGVLAAAAG